MAIAKSRTRRSRSPLLWVGLIGAIVGGLLAWNWSAIDGYGNAATAYSARVVCSCRYVGGRDLDDCEKDKLEGMELVTLSEDAEAQSITARFPLIASDTATYREGYGCVLQEWQG